VATLTLTPQLTPQLKKMMVDSKEQGAKN